MPPSLPPADLDCPDPAHCPVITTLPRLRTTTVAAGTAWYRAYSATWGYDELNPGYGDARFSPIDDPLTGERLPSMYLAASPTAALLESVFHEVHHQASRVVYASHLRGMLLAHIRVPQAAVFGDLRDPELVRHGLLRETIVATTAEHYPCTRRQAMSALRQQLRGTRTVHGLIWHSRQSELAGHGPVEVMVIFGGKRYSEKRGGWGLFGPGATSLFDGPGRLLIEATADELGAFVELDD